jgi:hypothetical protein
MILPLKMYVVHVVPLRIAVHQEREIVYCQWEAVQLPVRVLKSMATK